MSQEMPSFLPATEQPGDAAVVAAVEAAGKPEDLAAIKRLEEAEAKDPSVAHHTTTTEAVAVRFCLIFLRYAVSKLTYS